MELHQDISTRSGRKVARLGKGDAVVSVEVSDGSEHVSVASKDGHALCFAIEEVSIVKGAAKGVTGIKLGATDTLLAFELTRESNSGCVVEIVRPSKYAASRAGKGRLVLRRGGFVAWHRDPVRYDLRYSDDEEA
jgi:DNA gyrase subunit A